jgi:hypothetical protein
MGAAPGLLPLFPFLPIDAKRKGSHELGEKVIESYPLAHPGVKAGAGAYVFYISEYIRRRIDRSRVKNLPHAPVCEGDLDKLDELGRALKSGSNVGEVLGDMMATVRKIKADVTSHINPRWEKPIISGR